MGLSFTELAALAIAIVLVVVVLIAVLAARKGTRDGARSAPPKGLLPPTPMRVAAMRQFPTERGPGSATELILEDRDGRAFQHFVDGQVGYGEGAEVMVTGRVIGTARQGGRQLSNLVSAEIVPQR